METIAICGLPKMSLFWRFKHCLSEGNIAMNSQLSRRSFLALSAASAGAAIGSQWLEPALAELTTGSTYPVQAGDVTPDSAVIWTRAIADQITLLRFQRHPTSAQVHEFCMEKI